MMQKLMVIHPIRPDHPKVCGLQRTRFKKHSERLRLTDTSHAVRQQRDTLPPSLLTAEVVACS
jgi:hypothetical protein